MEKISSLLKLPEENQTPTSCENKPQNLARLEIHAPHLITGLVASLQKTRLAKGLPVKDFEDIELDAAAMAQTLMRAQIEPELWPELIEQAWADHTDSAVPFGTPQIISRYDMLARERALRTVSAELANDKKIYSTIAACFQQTKHAAEVFIESSSAYFEGFFECQTCGLTRPKLRRK